MDERNIPLRDPEAPRHDAVGIVRYGSRICTGSLVEDNIIVTAAHCFDFRNGPVTGWTFELPARPRLARIVITDVRSLTTGVRNRARVLRAREPGQDIAVARLQERVSGVRLFTVVDRGEPTSSEVVDVLGAGCRNDDGLPGTLRLARATFEKVRAEDLLCEGDSGGPVLRYRSPPVLFGIGQADFKGRPSGYAWMNGRVTDAISELRDAD